MEPLQRRLDSSRSSIIYFNSYITVFISDLWSKWRGPRLALAGGVELLQRRLDVPPKLLQPVQHPVLIILK